MLRLLFLFLAALVSSSLQLSARGGEKGDNVHGVAIVYVSGDMTLNEAEKLAEAEARRNALAEKYGTNVGSVTHDFRYSDNDSMHVRFQKYDATEVRGRWLRDAKKSLIVRGFDEKTERMWVKAEVWGLAKVAKNDEVEFDVGLLAGGSTNNPPTTTFTEGDRLRISFRSPKAGFLAIYILDKVGQKAELLVPNGDDCNGSPLSVMANVSYLFLDKEEEETLMFCSQPQVEYNTFYVLYSPETFSLPSNMEVEERVLKTGEGSNLPKVADTEYQWLDYVPETAFQKWIAARQNGDTHFQTKQIEISIRKRPVRPSGTGFDKE